VVTVWAALHPSFARWTASGVLLIAMAAFEPLSLAAAPVILALVGNGISPAPAGRRLPPMLGLLAGLSGAAAALMLLCHQAGYPAQHWPGYVATQLTERVAFNAINLQTWLTGLLHPVPFLGRTTVLFAPELSLRQLGNYAPGSFIYDGVNRINPLMVAQSDDGSGQLAWLLKTYIADDIWGYAASLPILFLRGIWAGTAVVALAGLYQLPKLIRWSRIEGRLGPLAVVGLSAAAIFAANTAATSNLFVLNPLLPTLYCYAIGYIARGR
jgi:hypothetical protein